MYTITDKPVAQGDMIIRKIDSLPENIFKEKAEDGSYILTHSETGHHHVVTATPDVEFFQHANDNNIAYLVVHKEGAIVEHKRSFDTHSPLQFSEGIFEIRRQIESVPQGFRRAVD